MKFFKIFCIFKNNLKITIFKIITLLKNITIAVIVSVII